MRNIACSLIALLYFQAKMVLGCSGSSLGYTCSLVLSDSYTLHYTATETEVSFAAVVQTTGWVGLGFSLSGAMIESEAVIGKPGTGEVLPYRLTERKVSGVNEDDSMTISEASIEQVDGVTTMRFTRPLNNGGQYTIDLQMGAQNNMIFAFSADGTDTLQYHSPDNRSPFAVVFTPTLCDQSDLGYYCSTMLSEDYILHYSATDTEVSFAAVVQTTGWVGLGFSLTGAMIETEAVIGKPGSGEVLPYRLTERKVSGVNEDDSMTISETSIEQIDGVTTMRFTRALNNGGQYTVSVADGAPNNMVFAFSADGTDTVQYHSPTNRRWFSLVYSRALATASRSDCAASERAVCSSLPCEGARCLADKEAVCQINDCGGCHYSFTSTTGETVSNCDESANQACRPDRRRFCQNLSPDDTFACLLVNWGSLKSRCQDMLEDRGITTSSSGGGHRHNLRN